MDDQVSPLPEQSNLGSEDLTLPRWRISKATGFFQNEVLGLVRQELKCVILNVAKNRIMWPLEFSTDNVPLCYSQDAISPSVPTTHRKCADCPESKWRGDLPPQCSLQYNYLLVDLESGTRGVLSLSRARLNVGRNLNSLWRMNGVLFPVTLRTQIEKSKKGDFYQVHYQLGERLPDWPTYAQQMLASRDIPLVSAIDARAELPAPGEILNGGKSNETRNEAPTAPGRRGARSDAGDNKESDKKPD